MNGTRSDKKKRPAVKSMRLGVLLMVLVFSTGIGILHQYGKTWVPVGVDALCPFGGIESVWRLFTAGQVLERIALSSFILLGATVVIAIVFRRSFCGNICPLGTLQELAARLGRLFFKKRTVMPAAIDKPLRYLKYAVLVLVAVLSAVLATLVIRPVDPWAAYQHLTGPDLFQEFAGGFVVLVASLALSLVFDRFFCKYLCPMGAFLGLVSKGGLFKVTRNKDSCIDCMACDKACPVNIPVQSLDRVMTAECLNCSECINACPVPNTLYYEGPKKARVAPLVMLIITFALFGAVVGSTTITGAFQWGDLTVAERVKQTGAFNPEAITGRSTFAEIVEMSGIPKAAFVERFQISDAEFASPMREAVHKEGATFSMDDVKAFVSERLGK
jgi:NapH/MauN family ferredoxin-type protein